MCQFLFCVGRRIKIYRSIILSVVLYGRETWSLTLREKQRVRVFEDRVLRKLFRLKRDAVTGECRRLNNGELADLHNSAIIIRVITSRRTKWAGSRGKHARQKRRIKGFGWKTLGKEATWRTGA